LLGPVELRGLADAVELGTPRQRAIVVAMAADSGRPVSLDTLIDRVWGEHPPADPRGVLYTYVARIRRALALAGAADRPRIRRLSGGYLFDLAPEQVDLHRFRRLLQASREPERSISAQAVLLREAVGLWQGEPLAGIPGEWAARTRDSWRGEHVAAVVAWARAELAVDNAGVVAGVLKDLADEHPVVESVVAVLMQALYLTGHAAEALDRFTMIRRRLVDGLGVEPGPELEAVHVSILRGELGPTWTSSRSEVQLLRAPPAQLPADVYGFAGRGVELDRMDAVLASVRQGPGALGILAVTGTAGVGKTALAVHWAHRVQKHFPDGHLYLNLHGFDSTGGFGTDPSWAIRQFLDALDVAPRRVPADLDAQTALYRSLLAGRRMLLILDNVRNPDQVRPLLPGAPGCLVLITSRNDLIGLLASEGAHPLPLGVPTADEARDVFTHRIDHRRAAAEPGAVNEIVNRCGRLPLALAVVAARAAAHPNLSLGAVAAELRSAREPLDVFTTGDTTTTSVPCSPGPTRLLPPVRRGCSDCSACSRDRTSPSLPRPASAAFRSEPHSICSPS
jgi:DNA-binding SARP family transcriptional activator